MSPKYIAAEHAPEWSEAEHAMVTEATEKAGFGWGCILGMQGEDLHLAA